MDCISIFHSIINNIEEVIKSDRFRDAYCIGNSFSRRRKLSFSNLVYFILNSSMKSLQINISDFRSDYESFAFPEISKQAISKARKGISHEAFRELFRCSVTQYYQSQDAPPLKTWHGYHVYGVDGTSLQIPNTKENISTFGASQNQHSSPCALASASILYDINNDIVVDATIDVYNYGERVFAREHLDVLSSIGIKPNTVITFDRGYPSYELYREFNKRGLFFLMRVTQRITSITRHEGEDGIFEYDTSRTKDGPVTLRTLKVTLEDGTIEHLVTNIFHPEIGIEMFKELYFLRWGVECKFKEFKHQLQVEEFSGYKPLSVKQDFYTNMLLSNLAAILKTEADRIIREEQKGKSNKYDYQANRGFILSRIKKFLLKMLEFPDKAIQQLKVLVEQAKKVRSQIRPNRKCERKIRNLRRKHFHNKKPCL